MKNATRATTAGQSLKSTLRAINDIYIIEEFPVETTYETGCSAAVTDAIKDGRLVIPEAYKNFAEKYPCRGRVLSKGDKCRYKDIKVGDEVVYARLGVQRYDFNGKMVCSVREDDLHGTVESS